MIDFHVPSPAEIDRAPAQAIAEAEQIVAGMLAVPADARSFQDTILPLEDVSDLLHRAHGRYAFMRQVGVTAEARAAAERCEAALDKFGLDLAFREQVYAVVRAYAETAEAGALTGERRRLLDRLLRDYRRNGFDLAPGLRARVRTLKERLIELGIAFSRTIDTWDDGLLVTRGELAGLPDGFIDGLRVVDTADGRRYRVSLDYPEFFPVMDNAESEEVRWALQIKFFRKGGSENVRLLEEAIAVRDELARLLGHPSWAAYVLEERMAKSPAAVSAFLADLRERLAPKLRLDLDTLTAEKRAHTGDPDAVLHLWDWRFYHNRLLKTRYAVDDFAVARYFPLEATLDGMFALYGRLFGVRFVPARDAVAWHPDVRAFGVEDGESGATIAHFFLDLFPRPNKFGHAAAFNLVGGRLAADGSYLQPVSAILANFTKPAETQPSLLRHAEVEVLFHEFGHAVHQMLTRAELPRFAGSRVERDFVEAPSQMLERWVWLPEVLAGFSRHVETGEPLPADLLASMVAAKRLDSGVVWSRQIFFAELDMAYHGGGVPDTSALVNELHPITGFPVPDDTQFQAGFGHLFGYDAGYYGYLWSRVFADDMFTRFERAGVFDAETGRAYRHAVLAPGGSDDGDALVRRFLGRPPTNDAFLRELGLDEVLSLESSILSGGSTRWLRTQDSGLRTAYG